MVDEEDINIKNDNLVKLEKGFHKKYIALGETELQNKRILDLKEKKYYDDPSKIVTLKSKEGSFFNIVYSYQFLIFIILHDS